MATAPQHRICQQHTPGHKIIPATSIMDLPSHPSIGEKEGMIPVSLCSISERQDCSMFLSSLPQDFTGTH